MHLPSGHDAYLVRRLSDPHFGRQGEWRGSERPVRTVCLPARPSQFLKQANGLDLGKIQAAFAIYNTVVRDKVSVTDAALQLDELFLEPPKYKLWQQLIIGGLAGAFIMPSAFYGSFIDCLVAIPLGMLLVLVQVLCSRNDLYSSLFE